MKVAIYLDIDRDDWNKYNLEKEFISHTKHILTDIKNRAILVYEPIIYKDECSAEVDINL